MRAPTPRRHGRRLHPASPSLAALRDETLKAEQRKSLVAAECALLDRALSQRQTALESLKAAVAEQEEALRAQVQKVIDAGIDAYGAAQRGPNGNSGDLVAKEAVIAQREATLRAAEAELSFRQQKLERKASDADGKLAEARALHAEATAKSAAAVDILLREDTVARADASMARSTPWRARCPRPPVASPPSRCSSGLRRPSSRRRSSCGC